MNVSSSLLLPPFFRIFEVILRLDWLIASSFKNVITLDVNHLIFWHLLIASIWGLTKGLNTFHLWSIALQTEHLSTVIIFNFLIPVRFVFGEVVESKSMLLEAFPNARFSHERQKIRSLGHGKYIHFGLKPSRVHNMDILKLVRNIRSLRLGVPAWNSPWLMTKSWNKFT